MIRETRAVLGGDIVSMARKDCRQCWGEGRFVVRVPSAPVDQRRREVLCSCAQKAFLAIASQRCRPVEGAPGVFLWLEGCAPEEWGFTRAWWLDFIHGLDMRAFAENAVRMGRAA